VSVVCLAATACAFDTADSAEASQEENVGSVEQRLISNWNDGGFGANTVGLTNILTGVAWQYLNVNGSGVGVLCSGDPHFPCGGSNLENFTAPVPTSMIRAVGISRTSARVVGWYSVSGRPLFSVGTPTNLSANQALTTFTPPLVPGSATVRFSMDNLIEADNSDNTKWYYYWLDADGVSLWRSTSTTAATGGTVDGKVSVLAGPASTIRGIAFDSNHPSRILTYYGNGVLDFSSNSLNLAQ
jgi:hypothetical protein